MYCGHDEFMVMPRVAIDLDQAKMILGGIAAFASIPGQWVGNVYVCTRCTHTTFFTLNGPTLLQRVPEATIVKAQGG